MYLNCKGIQSLFTCENQLCHIFLAFDLILNFVEKYISKVNWKTLGHSKPKSLRIENRFFENLRASLKEEITPKMKNLPVEPQREMLKQLKPKTGKCERKYRRNGKRN